MKTPRFAVMAIACLVACVPLLAQSGPSKTDALNTIVKSSQTDSVQYIERLAAFLFHEKLNTYRSAKQLNTLAWDDTLWLTARNHSVWMRANNHLSHEENTGTPEFNGKSPGDRYAFASKDAGKAQWCGENALYNYSANPGRAAAIAEAIAQHSLEQWEASPGHNENMLYEGAYMEGTAFIIDGQQVWATSMFARKPFSSGYKSITFTKPVSDKFNNTVPSSPVLVNNNTSKPDKKQTTLQMEKSIQSSLMNTLYLDIDEEKSLGEAAKSHASYMSLHQTKGSKEKKGQSRFTGTTPQKRVRKASHGFELFRRLRTRVHEMVFSKNYPAETFTADMAAEDAKAQFTLTQDKNTELKGVGVSVKVKKLKSEYAVYVVALERRSKSEIKQEEKKEDKENKKDRKEKKKEKKEKEKKEEELDF